MDTWSGFSDSEVRKVKQQRAREAEEEEQTKLLQLRHATQQNKPQPKQRSQETCSETTGRSASGNTASATLPSSSVTVITSPISYTSGSDESEQHISGNLSLVDSQETNSRKAEITELTASVQNQEPNISFECPPTNLELLTKQRAAIEEQNKKRKAELERALQLRYRQSQLEAQTLSTVKQELDKIDSLVSQDVLVLRNRIEEANKTYNDARKRFERAELEYIQSKLNLHNATEMKELLSEHLCAVIQQNEQRKSVKLSQLTAALEIRSEETDDVNTKTGKAVSTVPILQKTPTPRTDIWPQTSIKQTTQSNNSIVEPTEDSSATTCSSGSITLD